jgi:hypothetical protein
MNTPNALYLKDKIEFIVYPENEHSVWIEGTIKELRGNGVEVICDKISDDPFVENEFVVPYRQVRKR